MMKCSVLAIALIAGLLSVYPAQAESCVKKGGGGWGVTKSLAEVNAIGAIKMATGNWPVTTDRISNPVYNCKAQSVGWSCKAYATVCKKA